MEKKSKEIHYRRSQKNDFPLVDIERLLFIFLFDEKLPNLIKRQAYNDQSKYKKDFLAVLHHSKVKENLFLLFCVTKV